MKIQGIETNKGYIWQVTETATGRVVFQGTSKERAEESLSWNGTIGFVMHKVYA